MEFLKQILVLRSRKQDALGIPALKKNGVFKSDNTVKAT